jgi:hypothetical protein
MLGGADYLEEPLADCGKGHILPSCCARHPRARTDKMQM